MFTKESEIRAVIKAISKSKSLMVVHLDHMPFIWKSAKLQAYIKSKLGAELKKRPKIHKPDVKNLYRNDWKEKVKYLLTKHNLQKEMQAFTDLNLSL